MPSICKLELADEVIAVIDEDAYETARVLAKLEGIFGGTTSGAIVWAAIQERELLELERESLQLFVIQD